MTINPYEMEAFGSGECGRLVGQAVHYPCRLPRGHEGPCMAPDATGSVLRRQQWQQRQQAQAQPEQPPAPTKTREGDQPLPRGGGDCVQDLVIEAMEESKRVGTQRYGDVLRTFNGRKGLQDLAEEARDLMVYATMIQREAETDAAEVQQIVQRAIEANPGQDAATVAAAVMTTITGWLAGQREVARHRGDSISNTSPESIRLLKLAIYAHAGVDATWLVTDGDAKDLDIVVSRAPGGDDEVVGLTVRRVQP